MRFWSSHCGSAVMSLTRHHEVVGLIPGLTQWVKDLELLQAVVQVEDTAWCTLAVAALI